MILPAIRGSEIVILENTEKWTLSKPAYYFPNALILYDPTNSSTSDRFDILHDNNALYNKHVIFCRIHCAVLLLWRHK